MADLERSIELPMPPAEVFRYVASQWETTLDFWEHGIEDWSPLDPPPLKQGFRVEYVGRVLGVGLKVRMEVSDFEEGRAWTAKSMDGPRVQGDWRFEPIEGGTRFTYRLRYTMPPPIIGPLMDRFLIKQRWASAIEASLANLKVELDNR
jgi:hypothetical protein